MPSFWGPPGLLRQQVMDFLCGGHRKPENHPAPPWGGRSVSSFRKGQKEGLETQQADNTLSFQTTKGFWPLASLTCQTGMAGCSQRKRLRVKEAPYTDLGLRHRAPLPPPCPRIHSLSSPRQSIMGALLQGRPFPHLTQVG